MKAALATGSPAAKASQFVVYPEAGHAFHADYRPSYVASAAEDGWKRALAWFKNQRRGLRRAAAFRRKPSRWAAFCFLC